MELEYSADGFVDGCVLETVQQPCGDAQCGVAEGLVCGTCAVGQYCDEQRRCATIPLAPSAPSIAIQPVEPKTTEDLTCVITEPSTVDDGAAVTYSYAWMKDGSSEVYSTSTISASLTERGDTWTCEVVASANNLQSAPVSESVRILNTVPPEPTISVTPLMPYTTDSLVCEVSGISVDPDGDTVLYNFEWVNGATSFLIAVLTRTSRRKTRIGSAASPQ